MGKPTRGKSTEVEPMQVLKITQGRIEFCILGTSPLILNRHSRNAWGELLFPRRKTSADRQTTMKHDPLNEFRECIYKGADDNGPTRILFPSTGFKRALRDVSTDMPGAVKAQVGRLTYVEGDFVNVYGVPQMWMSMVRQAGFNAAPDVRTRAIMPEWAAQVTIRFVKPHIKEPMVANLLAAAGVICGIGDYRPEKGLGNYGQFELVDSDDARFVKLLRTGGLKAQDPAIEDPGAYDGNTADMYAWFNEELRTRQGVDEVGKLSTARAKREKKVA